MAATDRLERCYFDAGATLVAGCDEVGRGAWAGPVTVGVAVVTAADLAAAPPVADSKQVPARRRPGLAAEVAAWVPVVLGSASAAEIDEWGMAAALRLAAARAFDRLAGAGLFPDVVIQDGSASWLPDVFPSETAAGWPPVSLVRPKADVDCVAVAAASLVAKVSRDELMVELAERFPRWPAFATSAGYGTAAHAEQIRAAGLSSEHRVSWSFAARLAPADPLIVSGR